MLTILHISDLHFGPPFVEHVGEAVLRAARSCPPTSSSPAATSRSARSASSTPRPAPSSTGCPICRLVVVPGNHDVPLYRVFERVFAHTACTGVHLEELDACTAWRTPSSSRSTRRAAARHHQRPHRRWQLEFCARAFADVPPGIARIVVAHHHFAPAPDYEGGQVMPRAKRAIDCFSDLGVEMLLGGHLHRAYIGNSLDVYPGATASTASSSCSPAPRRRGAAGRASGRRTAST
jgi:3',5'-cyclic AMP phosphodiesterase CpdA